MACNKLKAGIEKCGRHIAKKVLLQQIFCQRLCYSVYGIFPVSGLHSCIKQETLFTDSIKLTCQIVGLVKWSNEVLTRTMCE